MLHLIFIETFEYHWDLCKSDVDYKVSLSQNVVVVLLTVEPLIIKHEYLRSRASICLSLSSLSHR